MKNAFLLRRTSIGDITGGSKKSALAKYLRGTLGAYDDVQSALAAARTITEGESPQWVTRMIPGGERVRDLADYGLEIVECSEERLCRVSAFATEAEAEAAHPLYFRGDGWGWSEVVSAA
jgi:hypothetical protein